MNFNLQRWFKWWIVAGFAFLLVVIFSEPPRLWFWLAILLALILYSFERAFNEDNPQEDEKNQTYFFVSYLQSL